MNRTKKQLMIDELLEYPEFADLSRDWFHGMKTGLVGLYYEHYTGKKRLQ